MKDLPNGVIEVHAHTTCTSSDRNHWYCSYVYLDGQQCATRWWEYPQFPGTESRVLTRDAIRAWVKGGGQI